MADADDLFLTAEDEIQKLREALEAKTREADELRDRYLRAAAEFDNARKRAAREREDYTRYATESLVRELLPVLDNFERALVAARNEPGAVRVVSCAEPIQRELQRPSGGARGAPFMSVGQTCDPERHEAAARVPAG